MIALLRIDVPQRALVLRALKNGADSFKGGAHGVIHIVVAVLTVSADAVQIFDPAQPVPQLAQALIRSKVGGIRFPDALDVIIQPSFERNGR